MKFLPAFTLAFLAAAVAAAPVDDADSSPDVAFDAPDVKATVYHGRGTFYYQKGRAGSCGIKHKDSDYIVAPGNDWMHNQYKAAQCGSKVHIKNTKTGSPGYGKVVVATVADTCPECDKTHLDMSTGLFGALTNNDFNEGTFSIDWYFQ